MKRLTVLVDMDDTIESLLSAWVERLNRSFGTEVNPDEVSEWDISKSFPTLTKEQVYSPLLCDDFWRWRVWCSCCSICFTNDD